MTEYVKNRIPLRTKRTAAVLLAAVLAFVAVFLVFGCAANIDISFSVETLRLSVGDRRDLFPYIEFSPSTAADKSITLSASNECVTVDGTSVIAADAGTVTVTATSSSGATASVDISVAYRDVNSIEMSINGDLIQNVSSSSAPTVVDFAVELDDYVDPQTDVVWYVNGDRASDGGAFEFAPPSYGEFEIAAAVQNIREAVSVKVYRETVAEAYHDGNLDQSNDFSPVRFWVRENIDTRNPRSVVEWTVNGAFASSLPVFEFTPPSSGTYEVEVRVNGRARAFHGGGNSAVVTAVGDRIPTVSDVVFDDVDGVFIKWRDGGQIRSVSVTAPDGSRTVYYRSDSRHSYRFSAGSFDASDIIDVCADEIGTYTIKLTADGQSADYKFRQYPTSVEKYLERKVLCNNEFISSCEQAVQWVNELYACGIHRSEAYIDCETESVSAAVKGAAVKLGIEANVTVTDSVISLTLDDYVNSPVKSSEIIDARRSYSYSPHIEYEAENRRSSSYKFAVDRAQTKVTVSNSEQLLLAVLGGRALDPVPSSAAQAVYSSARSALLEIIGAAYTDEQKIHAIYDWLTWVGRRPKHVDIDGSCRFIEGIFGNRNIAATGAVTSEGAAKTFALLCGIEGIECIVCSQNMSDTAYFWNKVKLNEVWYNVDVYGGIVYSSDIGAVGNFVLNTHKTLLISDESALLYGLNSGDGNEATDDGGVVYLQKSFYGGEYFDTFVDFSEKDDYNKVKAAVFSAFDGLRRGVITTLGVGGTALSIPSNYFGIELFLDRDMNGSDIAAVTANALRAIDEYASEILETQFASGTVYTYFADNILHVIALIPRGVNHNI